MSDFDSKTIKHLQKLSRIRLSEEEESELQKNLEGIVSYIVELEAIDTTDIPPCIRVQQSIEKTTLREDTIKDTLAKELLLENAPKSIGGMIQVPVVIDKE